MPALSMTELIRNSNDNRFPALKQASWEVFVIINNIMHIILRMSILRGILC
jgi:hypothetical protein